MDSIRIKAPAKLNLTLNIEGKRSDGYHYMQMVMQAVNLYDQIKISVNSDNEINVYAEGDEIPAGNDNTAYRAAKKFFETVDTDVCGCDIVIEKNIPSQAGLGGASSDAAGVLVGLNELCGTALTTEQLCEIGVQIGADVPFCIIGSTAFTEGIGEIITPLTPLCECFFVVVKPDFGMSTKDAFCLYDELEASDTVIARPDNDSMVAAIVAGDLENIGASVGNVFEKVVFPEKTAEMKNMLIENGALGAAMTGSGTAVFGIFESKSDAKSAARELENMGDVFVLRPINCGAEEY